MLQAFEEIRQLGHEQRRLLTLELACREDVFGGEDGFVRVVELAPDPLKLVRHMRDAAF